MTELPVLDPARCVGSAECVASCPTGCLEMRGPTPWLARPADCLACGVCVLICPAEAIRLAESPPA